MIEIDRYRETMTEAAMEKAIRDAIGSRGFCFHIRDSRRAPEMEGFPDLTLVVPDRRLVAFIELKSQKRRVTERQADVVATLQECDRVMAGIVRPRALDGEIGYDEFIEMLKGERGAD